MYVADIEGGICTSHIGQIAITCVWQSITTTYYVQLRLRLLFTTGVGAQDNTARLAPASPSRLPELDAAQMLRKMHLVVAQALSNAYLVRRFPHSFSGIAL